MRGYLKPTPADTVTEKTIRQKFRRTYPSSAFTFTADRQWNFSMEESDSAVSKEYFETYFSERKEDMRLLLCMYTTPEVTWDAIRTLPNLHLPSQVSDDEIVKYFFARFSSGSFVLADQSLKPSKRLILIETLLKCALIPKQVALTRLQDEIAEMKAKRNVAEKSLKSLQYQTRSPQDRAIRNVYTYIRSTFSKQLSADGGDTNAEITEASVEKLVIMLIDAGYLNEYSVLFDGGCSYNVFAAHIAQRVGCKVWGCEYVPTRVFIGAASMLRALEDKQEVGTLYNRLIAFIFSDLFALQSFGPTTLAYFFDEAFPLALIRYLLYVAANNSPSLQYIVSFKASKRRSVHKIFLEYGFERMSETMQVTKTGSKEKNTAYVYKHTDIKGTKSSAKPPQLSCQGYPLNEAELTALLHASWGVENGSQQQYYENLYTKAEGVLSRHRVGEAALERCDCAYCQARRNERKVLWLGMAYADTDTTTIQGLVDLKTSDELTDTEARDTARCHAAEAAHNVAIYTLAKDSNSRARSDRHIKTDFSKAGLAATIKRTLPTDAQLDQVSLDYMWMPNSYLHTSLGGTKGLTILLEGLTQLVRVGGLVFLPFHIDVLVCLSENCSWEKRYAATMINKEESNAHLLFEATNKISDEIEANFGKNANQELLYCKVSPTDLKQSGLVRLSPFGKRLIAMSQDELESKRFVQLTLLP
jgi:hypothetical protein